MKVLKGLVLTMLISTATIFPAAFEEDAQGLNNDSIKPLGISTTGSLDAAIITPDQAVKMSIELSSTEAAATILARLIGTEGVGEETSTALSTALNMLGADTSGAIEILQGLTSGASAFTGSGGSTIQDVLDVLTSEVASAGGRTLLDLTTDEATRIEFSRLVSDFSTKFCIFDISEASISIEQFTKAKGDVTRAYDALSHVLGVTSELIDSRGDLSAIVMGIDLQRQNTVAASSGSVIEETAEISEATRIEFSDLVSDFTAKLKTFNPFTVSTSDSISTLTVSVAGAYDALRELVDFNSDLLVLEPGVDSDDFGDAVANLSLSVMGLGLQTDGLQRQSSNACGVNEGSNANDGNLYLS